LDLFLKYPMNQMFLNFHLYQNFLMFLKSHPNLMYLSYHLYQNFLMNLKYLLNR
jgi:hypothetical protein